MRFNKILPVCLLAPMFVFSTLLWADAGQDFLKENANKPGVVTTASGLQYQVLVEGKGATPAAADIVKVHYHGTLIDGTVFDSSVARKQPVSFNLNQVIAGWTEGLQLMKVGGKNRLFVPAELAYGDKEVGPIAPNSTLIFEVELLGVTHLNVPTTLEQVKAYKLPEMTCGNPPAVPQNNQDAASIDKGAEYINCIQAYYKIATGELTGLVKLANTAEGELKEAAMGRALGTQQELQGILDPANTFFLAYRDVVQQGDAQ